MPGACATRNFTYLARGPWKHLYGNPPAPYQRVSCGELRCAGDLTRHDTPVTSCNDIMIDRLEIYTHNTHTHTHILCRKQSGMQTEIVCSWKCTLFSKIVRAVFHGVGCIFPHPVCGLTPPYHGTD